MFAEIDRRAFGGGPPRIGPVTQGEAEQSAERGTITRLAHQVYGGMKKGKWDAITKSVASLLRLASAATSLHPYLATSTMIHPPASKDREMHIAQVRAASVVKGGSGGCKTQVVDDIKGLEELKEKAGKEWDEARAAEQAEKERRERLVQEMEERSRELEYMEFF